MKPRSQEDKAGDFDSPTVGSNPAVAANLYLICHKVRGQPAFDIAERTEIDGEEAWILPSTGHRAYPFWHNPLNFMIPNYETLEAFVYAEMPNGCQDFWANTSPSVETKLSKADRSAGLSLLSQLGIKVDRQHPSASGEIKRRI